MVGSIAFSGEAPCRLGGLPKKKTLGVSWRCHQSLGGDYQALELTES